jgi:hypothetical protein
MTEVVKGLGGGRDKQRKMQGSCTEMDQCHLECMKKVGFCLARLIYLL